MKHLKFAAIAVIFGALTALSWIGITHAAPVTSNVAKGQTIDSSVYAADKEVRITGTVNGDLYCAGQDVVVSGTINGDVLCAGQSVTISGTVTGSIRAAAQDLTITGSVGRSVTLAGQEVKITKSAHIGQDATIAGNVLEMRGVIARDAMIASAQTQLSGAVDRNVVFRGDSLKLTDKALVAGDIRYTSNRSIAIGDDATVSGQVTHAKEDTRKNSFAGPLLLLFVAGFVFAMVLVLVWPRAVHATSDIAVRQLGRSLIVGLLATFAVPMVAVLLFASVIGAPLAVFMLVVGFAVILLSGPITAYYIGSMVLARSKNPIAIMATGSAVLLVLYLIPVVGFFAGLLAYLLGTGAILIRIKQRTPKPVYRVS